VDAKIYEAISCRSRSADRRGVSNPPFAFFFSSFFVYQKVDRISRETTLRPIGPSPIPSLQSKKWKGSLDDGSGKSSLVIRGHSFTFSEISVLIIPKRDHPLERQLDTISFKS
jgi:hypothetical protein